MDYRNNPLQSCSVQKLEIAQSAFPSTQYQVKLLYGFRSYKAEISCNTSANQFLVLSSTLETPNPVGFNHQEDFTHDTDALANSSLTLNVTDTLFVMVITQVELLQLMSPIDGTSLFYRVLTLNNLASLSISFNRKSIVTVTNWRLCLRFL